VYPRPFFYVVLVFLSPGPSVCEKPQTAVDHRVAQHPKFDSPIMVVLVGQILQETGFAFGTHQAFVNTTFLIRGVMMLEYPVAWSTRGWYLAQGLQSGSQGPGNASLLTRWNKSSKWEKQCSVNIFPNHGVT
jgi:hypothetical protein